MSPVSQRPPSLATALAALSMTIAPSALAGPWVQAPGAAYGKAYTSVYRTAEHQIASPTGLQYVDGAFLGSYTGIYAEVGLAPRVMATASIPFVFAVNQGPEGERYTNLGVGDVDLGVQVQLTQALPLSLRGTVSIPLYSNLAVVVPGTPTHPPFLGEGQLDVTGWISLGHSLHPRPFYGFVDLGYRHQTEVGPGPLNMAFLDALAFMAQGGFAGERWLVTLQTQGQLILGLGQGGGGGNKSYVSVGAGGHRRVAEGWWVGLEAEIDALSRLGTASAPLGQRLTLSASHTRP